MAFGRDHLRVSYHIFVTSDDGDVTMSLDAKHCKGESEDPAGMTDRLTPKAVKYLNNLANVEDSRPANPDEIDEHLRKTNEGEKD